MVRANQMTLHLKTVWHLQNNQQRYSQGNPQNVTGPDGLVPSSLCEIVSLTTSTDNSPSWQYVRLKTTLKKGTVTEIDNHRPLSMLIEQCISDRIKSHVAKHHDLLSQHHWAYTEERSTEVLVAPMTDKWWVTLDRQKSYLLSSLTFYKPSITCASCFEKAISAV